MRRDDPIPAPWTKAGKKRVAELDLQISVRFSRVSLVHGAIILD